MCGTKHQSVTHETSAYIDSKFGLHKINIGVFLWGSLAFQQDNDSDQDVNKEDQYQLIL